jgi:ligand-binding sensor domain-containing protein/tRNA A-37 threonylcarbamoyl transferase component Bud32
MRGVVLAVGLALAAGAETWQVVAGSEGISAPYDAVQTPDGYLWVSSGVQVHRYDGRRFVAFGEAEGLVARGVTYLAVDSGGALLAGSGAGLYRLERGRFRRIFEGPIISVAVSARGLIAANTETGILALGDGAEWRVVKGEGRILGQVSFGRNGGLMAGCDDRICEFSAEQLERWRSLEFRDLRVTDPRIVPASPLGVGLPIAGLSQDRWGRYWVRDQERVFVGDRIQGPYRRVKEDGTGETGLTMLHRSRGGIVYFGGPRGMAFGNAKGELEWLAPAGETGRFGGKLAYWDGQGSAWVGQSGGGLLRADLRTPLYRGWGKEDGVVGPVYGVLPLQDGRTALGTARGVYMLGPDEQRWEPGTKTEWQYGPIAGLIEASEGAVLAGANRGPPTLVRLEKNGVVSREYIIPPVADGPNVHRVLRDPQGFYWLGAARTLYKAELNGREVKITGLDLTGIPQGNQAICLAFDRDGRLLVPTSRGLYRKEGEKWTRWTETDGLQRTWVRLIAVDGNGRYWITYQGLPGVAVVDVAREKISVTAVPVAVGIGLVRSLLVDKRGWVWIGDERGLMVNREGGTRVEDFQRIGEQISHINKGVTSFSMLEDRQGRIWAGGAAGVIRLEDPALFVEERAGAAPVTVSDLVFDGTAGTGLRAQLQSPWLRGMEAVRFRWRLGSGAWQVSEDGAVRVEAVPAGTFSLEAQAEAKDGTWTSAVLGMPVASAVPWWQATWFWWVFGVALLGVGGIVAGRVRKAREAAAAYAAAKLAYMDEMPLFGEKYRGLEVIATGAFATVYRAEDETGRTVAVKRMHAEDLASKQLEREVESLRRISHPGVVGVLDFAVTGDRGAYLVLDYVPGPTLREALKTGPLARERVAVFARQLGEALGAAHAAGVIHRDLKPENIILRPEDGGERAVIVDFGIAVCRTAGKTSAQASNVGGTLFYLAPEQLAGVARPSADIYSFGVILCEVLTGRCPEISEDGGLEGRAEAARILLAGDGATELICGAMAYDPSLRPKDAAAVGLAVAERLGEGR